MNEPSNVIKAVDQPAAEVLASRLANSPGLERVRMHIDEGVVTLTGRVRDSIDKVRAEIITQNVSGVKKTINLLETDLDEAQQASAQAQEKPVEAELTGLAAMLTAGMTVVDAEGKIVGMVKTIRQADFLLQRGWARDVFVPVDECVLEEDRVRLVRVNSSAIDDQNWSISPKY